MSFSSIPTRLVSKRMQTRFPFTSSHLYHHCLSLCCAKSEAWLLFFFSFFFLQLLLRFQFFFLYNLIGPSMLVANLHCSQCARIGVESQKKNTNRLKVKRNKWKYCWESTNGRIQKIRTQRSKKRVIHETSNRSLSFLKANNLAGRFEWRCHLQCESSGNILSHRINELKVSENRVRSPFNNEMTHTQQLCKHSCNRIVIRFLLPLKIILLWFIR